MGETPQGFINGFGWNAANYLTKAREMTITNVAWAAGFSSPSTFARSFKQHFGVTAP
jgi:AraC-like DNA-binding protein